MTADEYPDDPLHLMGALDRANERIEVLETEIERLREALSSVWLHLSVDQTAGCAECRDCEERIVKALDLDALFGVEPQATGAVVKDSLTTQEAQP